MKVASLLVCFALALLASPHVAMGQCILTAEEVNALQLEPIKDACKDLTSSPDLDVCDTCVAAMITAFAPVFPKFQTCDEVVKAVESGAQNLEQDLAGILTPCGSLFLSAFQRANVPFANLLNLRSCPTEEYGTKTTDAFMAAFAKNCPGQEINVP